MEIGRESILGLLLRAQADAAVKAWLEEELNKNASAAQSYRMCVQGIEDAIQHLVFATQHVHYADGKADAEKERAKA